MSDLQPIPLEPDDTTLAQELHMPQDARLARYLVRGQGNRAGFTWSIFGELTDSEIAMTDMRLIDPPADPPASRFDIWQTVIWHDGSAAYLEYRFRSRIEWDADPDAASDHFLRTGDMGETAVRHIERARTIAELRTLLRGRRILGQYETDPAKAARAARTMETNRRRLLALRLHEQGRKAGEIADAIEIPKDNSDRNRQVRDLISEAKTLGLSDRPPDSPD